MSAILSADDLNDFISPGVACIKPVETLPPQPLPPSSSTYEVLREDNLPAAALPPAEISLTDCLACSGCVTSAEAVLVSLQSHNEVLANLSSRPSDDTFVALISPQSRASIATAYGVSEDVAGWMIDWLLCTDEGIGRNGGRVFDAVLDTNAVQDVALHYAAEEVFASIQRADGGGGAKKRPILTSSCPGFVCYLESTQPLLIPHLSSLKSPQAILATAVKSLLYRNSPRGVGGIFSVGVMPCFDKKLEGARKELTSEAWMGTGAGEPAVRDLDCVITTRELISLAQALGVDFGSLPKTPPPLSRKSRPLKIAGGEMDALTGLTEPPPLPLPNVGISDRNTLDPGTSGGYLLHIITRFLEEFPTSLVRVEKGRNADTIDYVIYQPSSSSSPSPERVIARLARCYGFRNIQNLVRRLKPNKPRLLPRFGGKPVAVRKRPTAERADATGGEYTYVEVMACPGGCTNGGGQVKFNDEIISSSAATATQKEWLLKIDEAYYSPSRQGEEELARAEGRVEAFVKNWEKTTGIDSEKLLFTRYRQVENDIGGRLGAKEVTAIELASKDGGGW